MFFLKYHINIIGPDNLLIVTPHLPPPPGLNFAMVVLTSFSCLRRPSRGHHEGVNLCWAIVEVHQGGWCDGGPYPWFHVSMSHDSMLYDSHVHFTSTHPTKKYSPYRWRPRITRELSSSSSWLSFPLAKPFKFMFSLIQVICSTASHDLATDRIADWDWPLTASRMVPEVWALCEQTGLSF